MKKVTVNTICDKDGFKQVFSIDGATKVWFGKWYDFKREIVQVSSFEIFELEAEGFNHALDILRHENYKKSSISENTNLRIRLNTIEGRILQKFGKKLKGKSTRSKINSFLR